MLLSDTHWLTEQKYESTVYMWSNQVVVLSLPVCRFGGAAPHGMARDCCVPPLLQKVSPHSSLILTMTAVSGVSLFKENPKSSLCSHPRQMSSAPQRNSAPIRQQRLIWS